MWHPVECPWRGGELSPAALVWEDLHPLWAPGMRVLSCPEEAPSPLAARGAQSVLQLALALRVLNAVVDPLSGSVHQSFFSYHGS